MALSSVFSVATLLLVALTYQADAHGMQYKPLGRQAADYFSNLNYEVTGAGRGGGPNIVSDYGKLKWPRGNHKICGTNPSDGGKFEYARKITGVLKRGKVAEFGALIWNQHGGRYGYRLCREGTTDESKCWQLKRADGKGIWFYPPADPADPTMTRMWSVYGANLNIAPWMGQGPSRNFKVKRVPNRSDGKNQFLNAPVLMTNWIIPNVPKGKYFVQWYWLTGNSCTPPCSREDPNYPNCRAKCVRPNCFCNDEGAAYPEEFWNCADVKVV